MVEDVWAITASIVKQRRRGNRDGMREVLIRAARPDRYREMRMNFIRGIYMLFTLCSGVVGGRAV